MSFPRTRESRAKYWIPGSSPRMTKGGKGNGPLTPQRSRRRHSLLLTVILGLDPRIHRPGTPSLPDKTPSHFPRPLNPCLQSPHPVTDTLPGVAVRRGRRFWFGTDVSPCRKGLRKMVSLRRHGGSDRVSDRPFRFHAPNGAPGVPVRHTRGQETADASASSAGMNHPGNRR